MTGSPGPSSSGGHPRDTRSVPIGGIDVARGTGTLRTFLGSCVGLVLYDRRQRIAGLAHVVLPESSGDGSTPGKYADTAVPETLTRLASLVDGGHLRLTAKLVGGARMFAFQAGKTVGDQNVEAILCLLDRLGIPVIGRDCGGTRGRRMTLDVSSGLVTVETVGEPIRHL